MKDSREIIQKQVVAEPVELERPFDPQFVAAATGRYPAYRELGSQEGFQLVEYWRAIRKRLWLVIGIAVLITTLTAIYMARKPDVFLARALVQVDLEQVNPDLVASSDRRQPASADPAYFNTQLQLLGSESLLRRVVKEHNLDTNKDFQQARADGSVSTWRSILKTVGLASDARKKEEAGTIGEVAPTATSTLASSEEIAEAVRLAPYVEIVRKNIGIEPIREARASSKDTRLIEVTFRHTNPELAAFVVNGIAETFSNINQERRSGTSRKTSGFLDERIANLQTEIRASEIKLVDMKEKANIINTGGDQTLVVDRLSALNKSLLEAENRRKNAEAQYSGVANSPDQINSATSEKSGQFLAEREVIIRNLTNDTQKKIGDLQARRAQLLTEYQEGTFEIEEVDSQIRSLEQSLAQTVQKNKEDLEDFRKRTAKAYVDNLRTRYDAAKQEEDKIRAAYNSQFNQAQGQTQDAVAIKLLEQEIETKKGFYENLVKNQSQNDIAAQGTENNISVAEIALPPDVPVAPRRLTTVLAALFLSTLFGMGLALFLEYLDDTIRTTEEIENYLQLPALAAIPTIDAAPKRRLLLVGQTENQDAGKPTDLLIHMDSRSALSEAYRQLRTSILLSTAGHAPKSLLITSSLPAEGKTTTATNTAISLAQTGARVLIIDADMRRPRLHSVFNISNAGGLSTILSSEASEAEMLGVIQYDEASKLHLLPSGPIPPNPAELIGSEQMTHFMKTMQKNFTHVVVDSPPIASFTDGVLIASMVDGVILVVHAGKSSKQVVKRSRQLLQDIGAKIFGVVLNNVNLRSQDNYYYYQSYYHRDSYRRDDEDEV